jgi:Mce-associated membrane protein
MPAEPEKKSKRAAPEAKAELTVSERLRPAALRVRAERRRVRLLWTAGWVLLVVAVAFAGWSGWSWWTTGHNEDVALAKDRDQVLRAGRQEVAALHTIDYRTVNTGLNTWLNATTGQLNTELHRNLAASRTQLTKQQATTTGTVTAAAVTAVDRHAGTAQLIATVTIQVTRAGAKPSTDRNRYQATLARTPSGWKLSTLISLPAT